MAPSDGPPQTRPEEHLDAALCLIALLDSWAWACSTSDEGANLDMAAFEGAGRLCEVLRARLEACQQGLAAVRAAARR